MVNDLISNLQNVKALMKFKGNHFDDDTQAQCMVFQKELRRKIEGFRPEEPLKVSNDVDQTDLEKQKLNKKSREANQSRLLRRGSRIFD